MKKMIIIIVVLGTALFFAPAILWADSAFRQQQKAERKVHRTQQQEENKAFHDSLQGLTAEQKAAALKAHHETQSQENKTFNAQQHQENSTFLKNRLASNTKLTDAQKSELISFFEVHLYSFQLSFLFWTVLGLTVALSSSLELYQNQQPDMLAYPAEIK